MTNQNTIDSIALRLNYPVAIGDIYEHHDLLSELVWNLPGRQTIETHVDGDVGHETAHGITLYLEPDQASAAQQRLVELLNEFSISDVSMAEPRPISQNDWANAWKTHWKPTPIKGSKTTNWVITPTWERVTPKPHETIITLDPGAAFGTGTHPTTQLMLTALAQLAYEKPFDQQRILDVGCGSGILAIAAAKLSCRDVVGIDVEPEAKTATEANATLNNVGHAITASTTLLEDLCLTKFDGVVMNIHWPILDPLIPEVAKRLEPNGWCLVSGLIEKTVPLCQTALESSGFTVEPAIQQGDWFLLKCNL